MTLAGLIEVKKWLQDGYGDSHLITSIMAHCQDQRSELVSLFSVALMAAWEPW